MQSICKPIGCNMCKRTRVVSTELDYLSCN